LRDDGEKLCAVLPDATRFPQTKECLVDESGRLQGVSRALAPQLGRRAASQLGVQVHHRPVAGVQIACIPGAKERCYIRLAIAHWLSD
jgi:hypothetical protein